MLRFFSALALAVTVGACSGQPADTASKDSPASFTNEAIASDTRLAAVLVYADWCGSCKVLDPKLTQAKAEGPIDGLQYFVLNYTDRDDEAFFASADALGFGAPIRTKLAEGVKTGILLLVDLDDGTIVGDLRKELSAEEIRAAMVAATATA